MHCAEECLAAVDPGNCFRVTDFEPESIATLDAVLFDRDGTLIADVPYNADPELVRLMPGARAAVELAKEAGLGIGIVSNQSGVGRGLLTMRDVERVNERVGQLLGAFDVWELCPHSPLAECSCRKPQPTMIHRAARRLGTTARRVALIGDIGSDVEAAAAAGARSVLVPTAVTLPREVRAAPLVAVTVLEAVIVLLQSSRSAAVVMR